MIYSLRGKPTLIRPLFVVLDCNGVGYGIRVPLAVSEKLSKQSGDVLLYTRLIVKENDQELYGFSEPSEAELFDFLRELHGIGPVMALNLISTLSPLNLIDTLLSGKTAPLQKVPRVGKAKADKILFEAKLKEKKLKMLAQRLNHIDQSPLATPTFATDELNENLTDALESLGFQPREIEKAALQVQKNHPDLGDSLQEIIRTYLKYL